jgi:hypothetical protein
MIQNFLIYYKIDPVNLIKHQERTLQGLMGLIYICLTEPILHIFLQPIALIPLSNNAEYIQRYLEKRSKRLIQVYAMILSSIMVTFLMQMICISMNENLHPKYVELHTTNFVFALFYQYAQMNQIQKMLMTSLVFTSVFASKHPEFELFFASIIILLIGSMIIFMNRNIQFSKILYADFQQTRVPIIAITGIVCGILSY